MTVTATQRFTPDRPCPVCGGHERLPRGHSERCFGFHSADGRYAHCTREEHAGGLPLEASGTYAHRLDGECRCGASHDRNRSEASMGVAPVPSRVVAEYAYRDEAGALLFVVERREPKDFPLRRPDGRGGWVWNLGDTRRVLYRLPELVAADPSAVVLIPEGERDVDRLRGLGFVATCNPGGAGKWRDEYAEALRGRHVVVLPDADGPGRRHAERAAASLLGVAASVKVVEL